jgi:two-component system NtrC family sensor kinase
MKMRLYKIPVLIFPLMCLLTTHAQNNITDSLQKKILESVQKELDNKKGIPGLDKGIPGLDKAIPGLDFDSTIMFGTRKQLEAAFESMNKALAVAKEMGDLKKLQGGYYNLTKLDSTTGNYKKAYEHYKLYTLYRDSLTKEENEKKALQARMQYEFDKKQAIGKAEQDKKDAEQKRIKNIQYFTIGALIVLMLVILLFAFIQWRNNRQKKRANALLQQQKEKVEDTLTELKSTQSQLIHSEKMASLGELTAGIAHEIQNPLNFVNNFSDVNTELISEMKNELISGNTSEAISIANDIEDNEQKINHHGKRADAIVKGMLQHSRASAGQKELTNINALADEYLRLSYHGFRAKDKLFKAKVKTDYDETTGKIGIIPQEIGRALLNLYNNAFYTVAEKKKQEGDSYEPTIWVSTKNMSGKVEIAVRDNGNGIPQKVLDKIFQPFFTTKPTGQGTGLGLSLAYDIIKAHGGELKVETKEGDGSEFIINLTIK